MTFTVESKSQLARLLATENLTIEHQKIQTAKFDPKNRVLYCPIWQNMSGALYDLLMGHEVGHALYTPAEGWHDAVSGKGRNFKGFLNVVEDARIEKKIKRRYPGIRKSFIEGYNNLLARDFFGINNTDVNELSFIDRLNIYTKSGGITKINFDAEETKMVEQVEACESWEDVLRVTQTVFDYSKDEQFETFKLNAFQFDYSAEDDEIDGEEFDDGDFSDYDDESEQDNEPEAGDQNIGEKRDTDSEGEDGEKQITENSDSDGDNPEKNGKDEGKSFNPIKESKVSESDQYDDFEPTCATDNSFRQNETALLDEKCKPFVYPVIPKVIMENIITPASIVHKALEKYKDSEYLSELAEKLVKEFKNKNDRYVSLLAKEFEMKKAARAYAKTKTANTGDIDISKLYKYQVDDNIFKKMQRVPKGKSHGLVLLLDRSGSMSQNMAGSIEQILVLTQFCRKVNIPFVVYGFGDSADGRMADYPNQKFAKGFSEELGELALGHVFLREYINSRMNNSEYNRCLKNMVALKASYENQFRCRPANEHLSNTPLVQAMVALEPLTKQFRQVNNLDLVNLVIVHDGDADSVNARIEMKEGYDGQKIKGGSYFDISNTNVYIKDRNSKLQVKISNEPHKYWSYNDGMRVSIFDWFRATTGAKIFGFFIAGEGRSMRQQLTAKYINKDGQSVYEMVDKKYGLTGNNNRYFDYDKSEFVKALASQVKKDKFIQSYNKGYDSFFIMPGGSDLKVEDEELEIEGKVTASKLKNAFMKMNKKKQVNRVMVSRFIDGIAA
jgi:cobalamin biosynthesis protein CobT